MVLLHALAARLGRTVAELEATMTVAEWVAWCHAISEHPRILWGTL